MEYFLDEVTSKDILLENMRKMNSFGDRLTGTKGHNEFCRWLEEQLHDMGQETFSNEYEFEKWEAKRCALNVGGEDIHVSSAFHYSGLTGEEGVAGELRLTGNSPLSFSLARGKIAVVRIKNLRRISSAIAFNKRASSPEDIEIEKSYRGPVSTSFVKTLLTFPFLKTSKAKGVVCI